MKKHVFLIALMLVCFASFMTAAPARTGGRETKGIHPWNVGENRRNNVSKEDANWSLLFHGGMNAFDGDFSSEKRHSVMAPSAGLGFEYRFNPTWGVGMDYTFRYAGVTGNTAKGNAYKMLRGFEHQAIAYLDFDIYNIFFPRSPMKLFALNLIGGGGALFWRNPLQYPTGRYTKVTNINGETVKVWEPEYNKYNTASRNPEAMEKYKFVGALEAGLSAEFNVSRELAVGLRAMYSYFVTDEVDGRVLSNNNDGVIDVEMLLRWKIQAGKKSHVNNFVNKEVLSTVASGGRRVREAEKDTVVVYHRDTINIFTRDTLEIFHRDTVVLAVGGDTTIYNNSYNYSVTNPESERENYFYVYFNPDRHNLSDEALVVIQQVADRLEQEPNLYAAIIGYCDNVGSVEYNKRLGQNRSQNVYDELLMEHGIEADRMFAISRGIVVGKRSSAQYAPNRRVEIRLVERSFFNELRAQYREDIESQKAFVKSRSASK